MHQSGTSEVYMNSHEVLYTPKSCSFNWFAFVMGLRSKVTNITEEAFKKLLLDFSGQLPFMDLDERDLWYCWAVLPGLCSLKEKKHQQWSRVLSESESSDQEMWNQGINNILGKSGRQIVKKQREAIHGKTVRDAETGNGTMVSEAKSEAKRYHKFQLKCQKLIKKLRTLSRSVVLVLMPSKE